MGGFNINDLTIVLANYGQNGMTWSQGCIDGDPTGTVDVNDLTRGTRQFRDHVHRATDVVRGQ